MNHRVPDYTLFPHLFPASLKLGLYQAHHLPCGLQQAGVQLEEQVPIEVRGQTLAYVSRGGLKLEKALKAFSGLDLSGVTAIDAGASTGGFTDCMLQRPPMPYDISSRRPVRTDGAAGPLCRGVFDPAFLDTIPGMTVLCPSSFAELRSKSP